MWTGNKSSVGSTTFLHKRLVEKKLLTSETSFCFTVVALKLKACVKMQQNSNRELSQSPLSLLFPIHPLAVTYGEESSPAFLFLLIFCLCWRPADAFLHVHINRSSKREREKRVPQCCPVVCLCQKLSLCLQAPRERTLPLFGPGPCSPPLIGIPKPEFGATLKPQSKCLSGKWRGE